MRRSPLALALSTAALTLVAATTSPIFAEPLPPGSPMAAHSGGLPHSSAGQAGTTGKVLQTMNAGTYTYVEVDDGSKKIWAAAPQFAVSVGDKVVVPNGLPMKQFKSKALGRTFDVVYFVDQVRVVGAPTANQPVAAAHAGTQKTEAAAQ